jgi:hypothetical protein
VLLRYRVLSFLDLLKQPDQELIIKRKNSEQNAVEGYSQGPHVARPPIVALLKDLAEHLWSHEVIGPFTSSQFLFFILQFDCPPKINNFYLEFRV